MPERDSRKDIPIEDIIRRSNVLYGKKYVACGDSFTEGDFSGLDDTDDQARKEIDMRSGNIILDEWFEKWFNKVKSKKVKQQSIAVRKRVFYVRT